MKKQVKIGELRALSSMFFPGWAEEKKFISMGPKNLYRLIALKKEIESHLIVIEETLAEIAKKHGGVPQNDGSIQIPPEGRQAASEEMVELSESTVEIEFSEIVISEDDLIPLAILEPIFDFVKVLEN